jgi:hypothetical protein
MLWGGGANLGSGREVSSPVEGSHPVSPVLCGQCMYCNQRAHSGRAGAGKGGFSRCGDKCI